MAKDRIGKIVENQGYRILGHQRHQPCPRCSKRYYCLNCKVCEECKYSAYDELAEMVN